MAKGTIKRLMDRGFGFIETEREGDLFFHRNELEGVDFNSLREGQEVEFEKGQGRDGRPCAVKVKLAGTEDSQAEAEVGSTDTEAEAGSTDTEAEAGSTDTETEGDTETEDDREAA